MLPMDLPKPGGRGKSPIPPEVPERVEVKTLTQEPYKRGNKETKNVQAPESPISDVSKTVDEHTPQNSNPQRPTSLFTGKPTPYTKEYIYEVNTSEQKTPFSPADHGFSYEGQKSGNVSPIPAETVMLQTSPGGKRAKGLAFTYVPPETEKDTSQNEVVLSPQILTDDNRIQDVSSEWNDTTIDESLKWDDSKDEEMIKNKENLEIIPKVEQKQKLTLSMFKKGSVKEKTKKQDEKKVKDKKKDSKKKEKEEKDKKSNKSGKSSTENTPNKRDSNIEADLQVDEIVVENIKEVSIKEKEGEEHVASESEEKIVKDEFEKEKENKMRLSFSKKSKSKDSMKESDKKSKDDEKKQKEAEKKTERERGKRRRNKEKIKGKGGERRSKEESKGRKETERKRGEGEESKREKKKKERERRKRRRKKEKKKGKGGERRSKEESKGRKETERKRG